MDNIIRTRIERIWELDRQIRGQAFPNCTSFARHWAEKIGSGKPVERKTVQRDITWMRDFLKAPIAWSASDKGYYYTDESWVFPTLRLNEGELVALLLARQMSRLYRQTPIAGQLDAFFAKLTRTMTDGVGVDPVLLGGLVSFHGHPARSIRPGVWEAVFQGLRQNRILRVDYANLVDGSSGKRDVEPVHLANVDDDWFLLGYCLTRGGWRHFSLSRIASIKATNRTFVPREDFDPETYFANRFGKFIAPPETRPYRVSVRFAPSAAPFALERQWHPAQKVKREKGGGIVLTLPIPSLMEAKRFCLACGDAAEVLGPPELRDLMRREVEAMAKMYAT